MYFPPDDKEKEEQPKSSSMPPNQRKVFFMCQLSALFPHFLLALNNFFPPLSTITISMDFGRVLFAIIGFSMSFFLFAPNVKRWHRQRITTEKLRIINEALEQAEERAEKFQERHDQILGQICSYYLTHTELEEALAGARAAMNQAVEFAAHLRRMQMKLIRSFPYDHQVYDFYAPDNAGTS